MASSSVIVKGIFRSKPSVRGVLGTIVMICSPTVSFEIVKLTVFLSVAFKPTLRLLTVVLSISTENPTMPASKYVFVTFTLAFITSPGAASLQANLRSSIWKRSGGYLLA